MSVAQTILEQLGGNRFAVMTGAKAFIGNGDTLSFRLPSTPRYVKKGINHVRITLDPSDTYTVKFFKVRGARIKMIVEEYDGIYSDGLRELFTRVTGLYTSFGG